MPEGDTIRRLAAHIQDRFGGATVARSVFRMPQVATLDLAGRTLQAAEATGKHLLLRWDDGWSLRVHLRMQGRVFVDHAGMADRSRRRFELHFAEPVGGRLIGIDIPVLEHVRPRDERVVLSHLGPDVCGSYDHDLGLRRLRSAGEVAVTAALLDQRIIAGLGNVYAVETPFLCGIDPRLPVARLEDVDPLLSIAVALIRTNAALGPQNTTGRRLHTADQFVLPERARDCRLCGERLERRAAPAMPWNRKAAWCPTCQPADRTAVDHERARRILSLHPARRLLDLDGVTLRADTTEPVEVRGRR